MKGLALAPTICDNAVMVKQLISELGGVQKIAADLQVSPGAVRNWQLAGRNIPWKYRPAIARIAAERAVSLPESFWDAVAA